MSTLSTHSPENLYSSHGKDTNSDLRKRVSSIKVGKVKFMGKGRGAPIKVSLFDELQATSSEANKKAILPTRELYSTDKDAYTKAKQNAIPAFYISQDFYGKPTHIGCLDIDRKDNIDIDFAAVMQELQDINWIMQIAFSLSNDGFYILFTYSEGKDHKQAMQAAIDELFLLFGINCDDLRELSRLRAYSYDPNYYINWNATNFDFEETVAEPKAVKPSKKDSFSDDFANLTAADDYNQRGLAYFNDAIAPEYGLSILEERGGKTWYHFDASTNKDSMVVFTNNDVPLFTIHSSTMLAHLVANGAPKDKISFNLYDLTRYLTGKVLYVLTKELNTAGFGFGTFNEAQPIKTNLQDANFRNKYRINVSEVIPPPQVALYINDEILGTLGNFSLITGKAKAKKSFLISMAVATALTDKVIHGILKSEVPANQNQVLFFDTEQGKYHVQRAVKRICEQIGVAEPDNLHAFHLRSLTPSERLQFIEAEIYSNDNIGVVIIDGIKDLITSINDEGEATMIASKLLKWSEERNIHILTVLHQNKGDNNARGHIGTELINKAETVLSVTVVEKDKEVSIVEAQQTRNREPQPFAFRIDENGIPFIISDYEATPINSKISVVYRMQDLELYEILSEAFKDEKSIKYADLVRKVKEAYIRIKDSPLGDNKAKDLISICKGYNFIKQSAEKQPYTLLPFTEITS